MKRTLAKVLSIVTVVSMAAVPTYASAATETADSNTSVYLREISTSNGDRAVIGTQGQKRLHNRSCLKRILLHLVKTYSPDQLEAFEEAFEIHRELHEELKEIRLELKEKYTPDELKDIAKEVRKEMKEWIKENGNKKSEVKALLRDLKRQ